MEHMNFDSKKNNENESENTPFGLSKEELDDLYSDNDNSGMFKR